MNIISLDITITCVSNKIHINNKLFTTTNDNDSVLLNPE